MPWGTVLLKTAQLIKEFPAFYGIQGSLLCKTEVFTLVNTNITVWQKGRLRNVISQKIVNICLLRCSQEPEEFYNISSIE